MSDTEIVQIKLSNGDFAYVEVKKDDYEEMGIIDKIFETSSEFVKVASDMMYSIKDMPIVPDSIELELGVELKILKSGVLAWVAGDTGAGIKVKMVWKK